MASSQNVENVTSKSYDHLIKAPPLVKKIANSQLIAAVTFIAIAALTITTIFCPTLTISGKVLVLNKFISNGIFIVAGLGITSIFYGFAKYTPHQTRKSFQIFEIMNEASTSKDLKQQKLINKIAISVGIIFILIAITSVISLNVGFMVSYIIPSKALIASALITTSVVCLILYKRILNSGREAVKHEVAKTISEAIIDEISKLISSIDSLEKQLTEQVDQHNELGTQSDLAVVEKKKMAIHELVQSSTSLFQSISQNISNTKNPEQIFQALNGVRNMNKNFEKCCLSFNRALRKIADDHPQLISQKDIIKRVELCKNTENHMKDVFESSLNSTGSDKEALISVRKYRYANLQTFYENLRFFYINDSSLEKLEMDIKNLGGVFATLEEDNIESTSFNDIDKTMDGIGEIMINYLTTSLTENQNN